MVLDVISHNAIYTKRFNFLIVKSSFILQNFALHICLLILTYRGNVGVI